MTQELGPEGDHTKETIKHWLADVAALATKGLVLGVLPGVLIYLVLFATALMSQEGAEYMGVDAGALASTLMKMFKKELISQQLGIAGTYAQMGAIVGAFAFGWITLFNAYRKNYWRWYTKLGVIVVLILVLHSLFLLRSMGTYPQIYELAANDSALIAAFLSLGVDVLPIWASEFLGATFLVTGFALAFAIAWRRFEGIRNWVTVAITAAVLVVITLIAIQDPRASKALQMNAQPNVLILAVDSLRGDLLGKQSKITPHLNALTARSVHFKQVHTVLARTFPSWVSIFTGQYPHAHGIRHMFPAPKEAKASIPQSVVNLFKKEGYRTGVITDSAGEIFTRVELGFEHVDAPEFTLKSNVELGGIKRHVHLMPYIVDVKKGDGYPILGAFERLGDPFWLSDRAAEWIGNGDHRPFFLTVFYSAGHFPFASPAPYYGKYTDPNYRGRSRFAKATFGKALEGEEGRAEKKHIRGLYAGALSASDAAMGQLLTYLKHANVLDNTIVIVTADHGENLYEHGLGVGHGNHLYGPAGHHVPLLISHPDLASGVSNENTISTIDIAPTLLELAGIDTPASVKGQTLIRQGSVTVDADRPVYAETGLWFFPPETKRLDGKRIQFFEGFSSFRFQPETTTIYLDPSYDESVVMAKHRMLLKDGWKILYIPTREGVLWELYQVKEDPWNLKDLSAEPAHQKTLKRLKETMYAWLLSDKTMTRVGDFVVPKRTLGWTEDKPAKQPPQKGGTP